MSSKSKHHRSSGESKAERYGRSFLAFALSLTISLLSLCCCIRFAFVTPQSIVGIFTDEKYVASLREDVLEYGCDVCRGSMLPEDSLNETITYEKLYKIVEAYISGSLGASQEFTKTTYEDINAELKKDIENRVKEVVKSEGLTPDAKQKKGAEKLSEYMSNYILERIKIAHIDMLETVINIGNIASLIGIIVSAVFSLILILIIISIGEKRYRSMRSVIHSVNAAGLINLSLIAGLQIVKHIKSLVLYPTYVADAFMKYINRCENAVGISALLLFIVALILMSVVWKLSRDSKK